jgi:hypothetical protein
LAIVALPPQVAIGAVDDKLPSSKLKSILATVELEEAQLAVGVAQGELGILKLA